MRATHICALALIAAFAVSGAASQAQEEKFTFKDGVITFDKKGFKEEFDKMQADLAKRAKSSKKVARSIFKNTYCIDCGGAPPPVGPGDKFTCRAVVGGRIGKGLCLLGGASACREGVASVTDGAC